jgi:hypothetical protein
MQVMSNAPRLGRPLNSQPFRWLTQWPALSRLKKGADQDMSKRKLTVEQVLEARLRYAAGERELSKLAERIAWAAKRSKARL